MRSGNDRVVVAVAWTPVATQGRTRKAVGGFLRYVQYRDKHQADATMAVEQRRPDAELRYVAHRDRAAGRGRLFDTTGTVGDEERRALAAFVGRAAAATKAQLWRDGHGELRDRRRAVYRFVISPERAEGLCLRRLTEAAVAQLEADAGGPVKWIAAEHRNTSHPHVHLIVAGFRETEEGRIHGLVLNKPRLERLKEAIGAEIDRERGIESRSPVAGPAELASGTVSGADPDASLAVAEERATGGVPQRTILALVPPEAPPITPTGYVLANHPLRIRGTALFRLAARYRWQAEREAVRRLFESGMEVA